MICVKCGKTIADDCLFCPECGARADGCVTCKNCGEVNKKEAQTCVKCGARLDGKEYCQNCGALVDGNFCSACGYKIGGAARQAPVAQPVAACAKPKATFIDGFRKVERILSPVLMLFVILILFCCSFGMGVDVEATNLGAQIMGENGIAFKSGGMLYFFGQSFLDTRALISSYSGNVNYQTVLTGMQTSNVISLIAIIVNLAVVVTCLITAAIKTGVGLKKGEKPKTYKYAIFAFVTFFVCATIVKDANYVFMDYYANTTAYYATNYYYISMSAGSVLGIFFSVGPIFLSFVLSQISLGKEFKSYGNLARVIPAAIMALILLFVMGFIGEASVLKIETNGTAVMETEYSLATLLTSSFYQALLAFDPTAMQSRVVVLIFFYITHLSCIILLGVLLKVVADLLFNQKTNSKWVFGLSIATFAVCVASSIFPILLYTEYVAMANAGVSSVIGGGLGAGVTAPFVMTLLLLGCAITYFVLNKNKNSKKE